MTLALQLDEISAGYHGKTIIHGVSLHVPAGGALTVIGPNGSGKSTLLKAVVGLLPLASGTLTLGASRIDPLDAPGERGWGWATYRRNTTCFRTSAMLDNLKLGWEGVHGGRRDSASATRPARCRAGPVPRDCHAIANGGGPP